MHGAYGSPVYDILLRIYLMFVQWRMEKLLEITSVNTFHALSVELERILRRTRNHIDNHIDSV